LVQGSLKFQEGLELPSLFQKGKKMSVQIQFQSQVDWSSATNIILCHEDGTFIGQSTLPEKIELPVTLSRNEGTFYTFSNGHAAYVYCVGKQEDFNDSLEIEKIGGKLFAQLKKFSRIFIHVAGLSAEKVTQLAFGALMRSWRFETYHTQFRPLPPHGPSEIIWMGTESQCSILFQNKKALAESYHWVRQLVNEPGNILYPESYVQRLRSLAELGIQVEILDQEEMKKQGFGALLGVAQGSAFPPYLAVLSWKGTESSDQSPLAFVGKGVTFDTGGISIKPSQNMEEMKMDMTGSAVVCGVLRYLASIKAPLYAVAVVALVENMPSANAQRPGDIVTSLSGQTIEVLNTDAEGRLILADALWYTASRFNPSVMIDVATLTGAARVALGPEYAAVLSPCDRLSQDLIDSGKSTSESLWRLPLCKGYDEALNSDAADIKNITSGGYGAGTCTAAQFLKRFVKKTRWAHLDIAPVDHITSDTELLSKGGTAFGLRLLSHFAEHFSNQYTAPTAPEL
jgi:leucyl aminopeptidase